MKKKKVYKTKKRKASIRKAYALLITIIVSSAIIGNSGVRTNKTIEGLFTGEPIVLSRFEKIIINGGFPEAKAKEVEKSENPINPVGVEETKQAIHDQAYIQCTLRGFGDWCVKDLTAIAYTESRFNCDVVGDGGSSYGCYQIHRGYHSHITVEQAKDISWSTAWTLNRLVNNGYPVYRKRSLRSHNGSPANPKTKAYLDTIEEYINNSLGGL